MSCPDWVALVRNPSLPATVAAVTLVETHIWRVLLTAERGYKIKKPADFGFLDFSTISARRSFASTPLRAGAIPWRSVDYRHAGRSADRFAIALKDDAAPAAGMAPRPANRPSAAWKPSRPAFWRRVFR